MLDEMDRIVPLDRSIDEFGFADFDIPVVPVIVYGDPGRDRLDDVVVTLYGKDGLAARSPIKPRGPLERKGFGHGTGLQVDDTDGRFRLIGDKRAIEGHLIGQDRSGQGEARQQHGAQGI